MRALLVIAVVLLASVFANTLLDVGDQLSPELLKSVRMIQLAENEEPIAVTLAELLEMKINGASFFDVTDRQYRPFGKQAVPQGPALPNQPQQKAIVNPLLKQLSTDNLRSNVEILSAYRTRFYSTTSGTAAAHWIHDTLLAYSSQRNDVTVSFFHSNTTAPQPSVIARLEGALSTDVVIIGSHEDSVHLGAAGVSPGVDDDGSGTVCVLEIFRVLMENNYKPNRTIEFHFYAAEEVGLLGSQAVATQYAADNTVVVGMMQLDMTFYIGKNGENLVGIVTDFVDADLTAFSRMLVDSYLDIGWINTVCGYGCSDHASWTKEGYRSTFPFESQFAQHNPYIHTAKDTLAYADLDHGLEFAKLGLGFVVELAATVYRT